MWRTPGRGFGEGRGRRMARTWSEAEGYFQERGMNLKDGTHAGGSAVICNC